LDLSLGGGYSHSSSKETFKLTFDGVTLKIPGLHISAWISEICHYLHHKIHPLDHSQHGSVAKDLAPLQNQKKPSQLGYLIDFITDKITHKGKNYSLKLRKYYFCTRTAYYYL
jgi:hypothetical protein